MVQGRGEPIEVTAFSVKESHVSWTVKVILNADVRDAAGSLAGSAVSEFLFQGKELGQETCA